MGEKNEIHIYLHNYKKSEYRAITEAGASAIRKRPFPEDARMGTGKYESIGNADGNLYGGCICTPLLLFLSDSKTGKRI